MPTFLTEIIKLNAAVNAHERLKVMMMELTKTIIQTVMPEIENGERVLMKIRGKLAEWLVEIDATAYSSLVVIECGVTVLYLNVLRAMYGMVEAILL